MAEIGKIIDGKYEILKEIGKGGMSTVYLSMDKRLNKPWAVKEIRKKESSKEHRILVQSFLAEANLMKRLDHPAFPRIVDIIDNSLTIYVVMDYIGGQSLDKVLKEYGAQPEEFVISWAKQLCEALFYLHSQNPPVIYRDMKPANVMLKPDGNVKIIDFGIAGEYQEQSSGDTTALGTKGYAPPEQYHGQTDVRSDIYGLGMTLYHLLTGRDPRDGNANVPVHVWNPELSEGIEMIVAKCVQTAAEHRYQSCKELLYDLNHPELITKGYKRKQKNKLMLFVTAAALGMFFLIAGVFCRGLSTEVKNDDYEALISQSTAMSLERKTEGYKRAIDIYPERTEAYIKLLEAYEDEGRFGKEENDQFLALYNTNKDTFDRTRAEVAELNYKIGRMYFNYYTDYGRRVNFSVRVQKAYSFFASNYENQRISPEFSHRKLSDCYYQICAFYKKYILQSAAVEEASKENYETLLNTVREVLREIENLADANTYDKLAAYNGAFMLLYDQRISMAQVGINKEQVLGLLDEIHESAEKLAVKKEQVKKLQEEILDNYKSYREAIDRAYTNTQEKPVKERKGGKE